MEVVIEEEVEIQEMSLRMGRTVHWFEKVGGGVWAGDLEGNGGGDDEADAHVAFVAPVGLS